MWKARRCGVGDEEPSQKPNGVADEVLSNLAAGSLEATEEVGSWDE